MDELFQLTGEKGDEIFIDNDGEPVLVMIDMNENKINKIFIDIINDLETKERSIRDGQDHLYKIDDPRQRSIISSFSKEKMEKLTELRRQLGKIRSWCKSGVIIYWKRENDALEAIIKRIYQLEAEISILPTTFNFQDRGDNDEVRYRKEKSAFDTAQIFKGKLKAEKEILEFKKQQLIINQQSLTKNSINKVDIKNIKGIRDKPEHEIDYKIVEKFKRKNRNELTKKVFQLAATERGKTLSAVKANYYYHLDYLRRKRQKNKMKL